MSAASVLSNLDKGKYDIYAVGITKDGRWLYYPDYDLKLIKNGSWENESALIPALISPDRSTHGLILLNEGKTKALRLDCVFPVLHGMCGEDGAVQGLMELADLPYVGCPVSASANSMDKSITKILAQRAGVRQADYCLVHRAEFERDPEAVARAAESKTRSFPVFIKPCSQGSSVGVAKAGNTAELLGGLREAFNYDAKVLVEEFIDGHEIECAVLGNEEPIASTVGEIAPAQEFYTYDAKYRDSASKLYIPAHITPEQIEEVRQSALKVYLALGCRGLSRIDFFCTYKEGDIVFNEINSIPGFTSISMYPKLFDAVGIGFTELLDRLISLAMEGRDG